MTNFNYTNLILNQDVVVECYETPKLQWTFLVFLLATHGKAEDSQKTCTCHGQEQTENTCHNSKLQWLYREWSTDRHDTVYFAYLDEKGSEVL
jgi:hypothetical protein